MRRAVFLDRDGVLTELVVDASGRPESPLRVEDVSLLPGAARAAARLAAAGYVLVGVSNQPAAAKGSITVSQLEAVQSRALALLSTAGVEFEAFELCLHHPEGVNAELSGACDCRKPMPGMLLRAAARLELDLAASWMVGDSDSDIVAGARAGVRTILIEHPESAHRRHATVTATATASDLGGAASRILGGADGG